MSKKNSLSLSSIKERKIFLSCMNTWFSNFIIEAFRTDYLALPTIKNSFMGTLKVSSHPLPRLFEPKEIEIEIGYNYNQEVFNNDCFIYNLDDANFAEVEFIIRGLKSLKYENEKILILVSNIMTWAKTPIKIKNIEDPDYVPNPNEEEFIRPKIEPDIDIPTPRPKVKKLTEEELKLKEEEEKKKEEEEKKKEEEEKKKGKKGKKDKKGKDKKDKKKEEKKKEEKKKEEIKKEEEEKKIEEEEKKLNEEEEKKREEEERKLKEEEEKKREEEERIKEEEAKNKIFYYKDTEYNSRIPNRKYIQYKDLETLALTNTNPMLKVYVICPGFIYGCGEDFFFNYFRMAYLNKPSPIPLIGLGNNSIPTIHILDLVNLIKKLIEERPIAKYILAVDKTKNPSMKNIIKCISKGIGDGKIQTLNDFNIDDLDLPDYNELNIDVKVKPSKILLNEPRKNYESKDDYEKRLFKWHCEYGIPENLDLLRNEFNLYRGLKCVKILILGPPSSGKTFLANKISEKLKLTHLIISDICDWGKELNNELGDEIREKLIEIEENIEKAREEYEKRKNKKKTDPPFDPSQVKKFDNILLSKIIKSKLNSSDCASKGYILDNYPKNYQDCIDLYKEGDKIRKDLLPDSVIYITNYTEESLRNKLKMLPDYEENQLILDARFLRRFNLYKSDNESNEPDSKKLIDFFNENNIDVFNYDEQNAMIDFDNNFQLVNDYLERNGPINSYERLMDTVEIIPITKEDIIEKEKKEEEKRKKEEEEIEADANFNIEEHEKKRKKSENEEFRFTKEKLVLPKKYKEFKEHSIDDEFEISKNISKQSSIRILKDDNGKKPFEERKKKLELLEKNIEYRISELKDIEKKLLEKKSEVLRRYLNVHIIPILAKGILHICEEMPDDPIETLANYLMENKINESLSNNEMEVSHNDFSNLSDKFSNIPSKKPTALNKF